ncbi:hypothetical protein JDV02_010780 [Purpureocillium takamizusanense]|uniref:Zn(2)-C6 fungal-type domain-containing protein n=1 Tax=Purpureocillium takamizusanense TaxID=2060973 RepID=A0A9Q8QSH5_9HYPO|nr:uncharacterized protein JDV02_010780 [Purpureocillium takamizusanense]UNI25075.1 hypothetical protein JDV02_010780 [Purpureocillium takamizusanense]
MTDGTMSTGTGSSNGLPAGYGRSCTNCSKAKCRCILRSEGGSCERCHRLGKECHQIAATRKRTSKRSTSSRTAQLEEKLEDLVSILRATQKGDQNVLDAYASSTTTTKPSTKVHASSMPHLFPTSRLDSLAAAATADTPPPPSAPEPASKSFCVDTAIPSIGSDAYVRPEPTPAEAEIYIGKFRDWLRNFPFMHLPDHVTADALRKERPFLWTCIMNMTSMSLPQQQILRDKVRQELSDRMVFNNERTMDVLLGLIAYISWATMNTGPGSKPFLILYSQLAATILYDMGLTRNPHEEHMSGLYLKVWSLRPTPPPKVRTMEERRAALALWYLTSVCTSFIGKMETLHWTSHMEESLETLDREKDQPLDEILVALVRTQLINEEAQKLLRLQGCGDDSQGPTHIYKPGLLMRLEELRRRLPPALHSHYVVQLQLYATEAEVHSVALFTGQAIPEATRISSMFSCTKASATWFEWFFSVPLMEVPGLPFNVYVSMSHLQAILYRLTTSEDPAWDKQVLRNTADLLVLLDKTIDVFCKVGEVYCLRTDDSDGTVFLKGARILRNVRNFWEPALAHILNNNLPTPTSQTSQPLNAMPPLEPKMMMDPSHIIGPGFDLNDMTWMTDIFGPWET